MLKKIHNIQYNFYIIVRKEKGEKIMSLYKQWTDMVVEYVKTKGEAAFWNEYTKI